MKKAISKRITTKKTTTPKEPIPNKINRKDFFTVGIGASAGGLEALNLFFDKVPLNSGMAYIVVQHLDPTHKSLLSSLLATHTKMKVAEVTDGMKVSANCVYTIPPNKDLRISNGILRLIDVGELRATRRPIDSFFHSLAEDQKEKAIGIILSGTGTEGTLGLKEIKAKGGITFVQDPQTAQFNGMPQSAIMAKTADYILPPGEMPVKLLNYIKKIKKNPGQILTLADLNENQLKKILQVIRTQTGYDFSNYKTNTIMRRIAKRMAFNQMDVAEDYLAFLQNHPAEIDKLYKDFLIGVTSFFRDKEVFKIIEKKAIPHLLEKCLEKQELRVWVCGCSTGQEAYSLAILFKEAMEKSKQYMKITIFASDIDKEAIEFARNGIYLEGALAEVSQERLSRYFIRKQNNYQLKKEIREMVIFAHHNVIKDPPFSKMNMISCRNLLIYMNNDLQKKVIPIFHYSLTDDGILLLGSSESIGDYTNYFSAFDQRVKMYKKKKTNSLRKPNSVYELPGPTQHAAALANPLPVVMKKKVNIAGLTEKFLLDNYAPPSVIIDTNNDALYFWGNTSQYLEPPIGEARLNILEMAKKELKPDLDMAIKKARNSKSKVEEKNIEIKVNNHYKTINLIIKPLSSVEMEQDALMVIFETAETAGKKAAYKISKEGSKPKSKIGVLEKELQITRKHLQSAINKLEISNEDLQTTNEEYQSSNEELQSTNEELETSREELQSVNEELITVNTELTSKIDQLSQANDDLNNLLSGIEVATIYLDRELKIKRFTPTATKIFNLIPSDIERPVTHLSSNIVYKALVEDVKNALKTLAVKSADVQATDGTWYHMRILPYRTNENVIEGVLVTFVDITDQKKTEEKLKTTNEHLNLIMERLPAVPFTCLAGREIQITFVGKSCETVTGFLSEQLVNKTSFWFNRIHPDDKKKMRSAFLTISKSKSSDLPFRWKCSDDKYKYFINHMRYTKPEHGRLAYVVGVWQVTGLNVKKTKGKDEH